MYLGYNIFTSSYNIIFVKTLWTWRRHFISIILYAAYNFLFLSNTVLIFIGLFNLRGADIAYNPVFFAYAIVEKSSSTNPKLYLREHNARLSAVKTHLNCGDDGQCPVGTPDCVNVSMAIPYLHSTN